MLKVKIKKLVENAVIPFKTHDSDFCYDCVATSEEEIAPGVWKYGLGLAFQIERTHHWFKDTKNTYYLLMADLVLVFGKPE